MPAFIVNVDQMVRFVFKQQDPVI